LGAGGCRLRGTPEDESVAAPRDPRNIVLVVIDSLRTDHVGAYGGVRARTPNLDAFAGESLRFTRARPESMPTVPARRAMLTGKRSFPFRGWHSYEQEHLIGGPGAEPIPSDQVTFDELMRRGGYLTAYVTDNPHTLSPPYDEFRRRFDFRRDIPGQTPVRRHPPRTLSDEELARYWPEEIRDQPGAGRLREYIELNRGRTSPDDYHPARVFRAGIEFLERVARRRRPFMLFVDSFDPHEPWDPPFEYLREYADVRRGEPEPIQPFQTPSGFADVLRPSTLERARALYAAEATFVDVWFGRLLDKLEELGLGDDTWVVMLSDHGVLLGERGIIGKSRSNLHRELWSVPFMIRHPERRLAGTTDDYLASTYDVGPTVLAAAGFDAPRKRMEGEDLTVLFRRRRPKERTYFTSALKNSVCACDDRWLLICHNRGGEEKLFDRRADPAELRDVASSYPSEVKRLYQKVLDDAGGQLPEL